jgi:hypothetical protein
MPAVTIIQGKWQGFRVSETLTEYGRRKKLETEFLELRSKMQDIYRSWNVTSCDHVS